jgi:hypothetical protein
MINVLFTVDTELSPARHRKGVSFSANVASSFYGLCGEGEFGALYQAKLLRSHGLKGVFFIEALHALVFGYSALLDLIGQLYELGQDVQLHLHTEWLPWIKDDPVGGARGINIADFSLDQQVTLLRLGADIMQRAGVRRLCAYRAGNFGANNDTLIALRQVGLRFDSSYNAALLGSNRCQIRLPNLLVDRAEIESVQELPVTVFRDYGSHLRPAQICAISSGEIDFILDRAEASGCRQLVFVCHSFELLNRKRTRANRSVVARVERWCEKVAAHGDRLRSVGFDDLSTDETQATVQPPPLRSRPMRTAWRYAQQGWATLRYEQS